MFLLSFLSTGFAEEINLKVWHSYRDAEKEAFETLLKEYDQSHPELTIESLAVAYDSYANKLKRQFQEITALIFSSMPMRKLALGLVLELLYRLKSQK